MKNVTPVIIRLFLAGTVASFVAASNGFAASPSPAFSQFAGTNLAEGLIRSNGPSLAEQALAMSNSIAQKHGFTNGAPHFVTARASAHLLSTNSPMSSKLRLPSGGTNLAMAGPPGARVFSMSRAAAVAQMKSARELMISEQLVARGISNPAVLDAMRKVPRLLPYEQATNALTDGPVNIRYGRTVESPYIVASVAEQFNPNPKSPDRVLEIGTGSGYQTAVLSLLVKEIYSIETNSILAQRAQADLQSLGYTNNVFLKAGDVTQGWPEAAPFDAIVVNGPIDQLSDAVVGQLKEGGQVIIQVNPKGMMQVLKKTGGQLVALSSHMVRLPPVKSAQITMPQFKRIEAAKLQ